MSIKIISSHILIESPEKETNQEFSSVTEAMVIAAYGQRPEWLRFSAGARFVRASRHFREFVCIAGSVSLFLMQYVRRSSNFQRAIIYRAEENGVGRAYEIRAGMETDFNPDELRSV